MPPPVEITAAQAQAQDLRHGNVGYYVVVDDHPPFHGYEYHGHATNNLGVPAQAPIAPPAPVRTDFTFPHTNF